MQHEVIVSLDPFQRTLSEVQSYICGLGERSISMLTVRLSVFAVALSFVSRFDIFRFPFWFNPRTNGGNVEMALIREPYLVTLNQRVQGAMVDHQRLAMLINYFAFTKPALEGG